MQLLPLRLLSKLKESGCTDEFGANGGKMNVFERLSIFDMHVAIDVGGPLIPDLVGSSFRNLEIHDVDVGLRFFVRNQPLHCPVVDRTCAQTPDSDTLLMSGSERG